jgi:hypothetical protein
MTRTETDTSRMVLASRRSAGILVLLLWASDTNSTAVVVHHDRTGDGFELLVDADLNPMTVYEHPYAHAAWRGVDYRTADLRQSA